MLIIYNVNMQNEEITQNYSNGCVITVGVFDGVHRGHQKILNIVSELSKNIYTKMAVTFYPHPDEVFSKGNDFKYIQTIDDRISSLLEYGADEIEILEFNKELASTSPDEFIEYLISSFNMKILVLGYDFALGKNRSGNYEVLKNICESRGISVIKVDAIEYDNEIISSSAIRTAILRGDLQKASTMLGRDFSITDTVIHGNRIGSSVLHFPTANIKENPKLVLPPNGVYAMNVELADSSIHPAAAFIGTRPTFNGTFKSIEMHILDFYEDIYDQEIKIIIKKKIRDEIKFNSPEELMNQINLDIKEVRQALS